MKVDQSMGTGDVISAHKYMRKVLSTKAEIKQYKDNLVEMKAQLHTKKFSSGLAFVTFQNKADRDLFL